MRWELESSTKIILKVILILLAVALLWLIRDIVLIFLLGVVLASAMEPMVEYLQKKARIPRVVSVLAVYIIVLGGLAAIIAMLAPLVVDQSNLFLQNLPVYSQQLQDRLPALQELTGGQSLADIFRQTWNSGNHSLFADTIGVFNGALALVSVLVISFYLVAEQKGMIDFIKSLVPLQHQEFTMQLVRKVQLRMGRWILGQIILSFSIFLLTYIGLSVLGVRYALFLALLAGLLEVVPYIGPMIAGIPAVFFAFGQSPALAIAVVLLYMVVQQIENYFLTPKIMGRTLGTSPLLILISLLVGFKLAGILGLLLAVPLASAITLIVTELTANQAAQKNLS
jgi:predicted PurR-regulated permease PerM